MIGTFRQPMTKNPGKGSPNVGAWLVVTQRSRGSRNDLDGDRTLRVWGRAVCRPLSAFRIGDFSYRRLRLTSRAPLGSWHSRPSPAPRYDTVSHRLAPLSKEGAGCG